MTKFETIDEYIEYIYSQLETVDRNDIVSSYDTGYGLHLTGTYLGDTTSCLDVVHNSILKLRPPDGLNSMNFSDPDICDSDWEIAWDTGCTIVRQFIDKKN